MHVFAYGSLMFAHVWDTVVTGRYQAVPANAKGWERRRIRDAAYPAMIAGQGTVRGLLWQNVGPDDLAALDTFEGAEYQSRIIQVETATGQSFEAQAWIWRPELESRLSPEAWRPAHWDADAFYRLYLDPLAATRGLPARRFWLMKSEPGEVSIDDLAASPEHRVGWFGVRNYLARNYMRDHMRVGDLAAFYHSSCAEPGIAGIVRVASPAYPDPTQFDGDSDYFDPKSSPDNPRWQQVTVELVRKTRLFGLPALRAVPELANMQLLAKGNRLSITPVSPGEWRTIETLLASSDLGGDPD